MATGIVRRQVVEHIKESVAEFAKRLPATTDATRWTMQLATAIQRNPDLMECDPASLLLAAYEAAELGVSLSPTLQLGYLIPYKNKAQFQISWRGLVQKAYESGCVRAFFAEVVYERDKFERQYAPRRNVFHGPADGDRGEAIGAYALVEFKDGTIDWEYADKQLIERHRKHSKQPDSLMWREFHEEAWRKTPIRILAKRLPMSNPGMEVLAEAVERDSQADLEAEPAGRIELEPESPLIPPEKAPQIKPVSDGDSNTEVFYQVGEKITTVTGKTYLLKDDLPKVGAKWDGKARVWTMPAARTHELLEVCEARNVSVTEVQSTPAETRFSEGGNMTGTTLDLDFRGLTDRSLFSLAGVLSGGGSLPTSIAALAIAEALARYRGDLTTGLADLELSPEMDAGATVAAFQNGILRLESIAAISKVDAVDRDNLRGMAQFLFSILEQIVGLCRQEAPEYDS